MGVSTHTTASRRPQRRGPSHAPRARNIHHSPRPMQETEVTASARSSQCPENCSELIISSQPRACMMSALRANQAPRLSWRPMMKGQVPAVSGRLTTFTISRVVTSRFIPGAQGSLEGHFSKTAQLAAVQALNTAIAQDVDGPHADAQMLVHTLAVEVVGHAGQFDLAVQRLG